jgi:hypothetical protein
MYITQCSLLSRSSQYEFQNSRYTHLPKCPGENYEICLHDLHDVQEQLSMLGSSSLQMHHHSQSIFICVCGCMLVCVGVCLCMVCVYVFVLQAILVVGNKCDLELHRVKFCSLSLVKCSLDS